MLWSYLKPGVVFVMPAPVSNLVHVINAVEYLKRASGGSGSDPGHVAVPDYKVSVHYESQEDTILLLCSATEKPHKSKIQPAYLYKRRKTICPL